MTNIDPFSLALALAFLGFIPFLVIATTSFVKIAVVIMLVRNALGLQQVPPNMALYSFALVLSIYVMAPTGKQIYDTLSAHKGPWSSISTLIKTTGTAAEPLRKFLVRNSDRSERLFFLSTTKKLWPPSLSKQVGEKDYIILIPSFLTTELKSAFASGLVLFLPFAIIDLVVSNILLALGMMMVSPTTIAMPLKLLLFVMVDGWTRLIQGLILSYH